MMTSDNKTHIKPRYIIIGCNIDNPYREFNLTCIWMLRHCIHPLRKKITKFIS